MCLNDKKRFHLIQEARQATQAMAKANGERSDTAEELLSAKLQALNIQLETARYVQYSQLSSYGAVFSKKVRSMAQ